MWGVGDRVAVNENKNGANVFIAFRIGIKVLLSYTHGIERKRRYVQFLQQF